MYFSDYFEFSSKDSTVDKNLNYITMEFSLKNYPSCNVQFYTTDGVSFMISCVISIVKTKLCFEKSISLSKNKDEYEKIMHDELDALDVFYDDIYIIMSFLINLLI